jgi:predicted amidohydrolase
MDALLSTESTDLAIVPELALTGYVSPRGDFDLTRFAEPMDGPTVAAAAALARRHQTHLLVPLVLAEAGRVYNACVLLGRSGDVAARYKKRHPWFPEQWASPGEEPPPIANVDGLLVTIAICFDGHFLAYDAAEALRAADLLVFPSAWVDDEDSRSPLLRSIARAFDVWVANANWAPGVVELPGQGGSCVIDPEGRIVATVPSGAGEGRRLDVRVG